MKGSAGVLFFLFFGIDLSAPGSDPSTCHLYITDSIHTPPFLW